MSNKIGVAIITCDREEFFKQCVNSIPEVDSLIVINDGFQYNNDCYPKRVKEVFQHTRNKSVGISKNEALRFLVQDGCDHIFLCEDDIIIKNPDICRKYIHTAEISGIWHLNYGGHGIYNRNQQTGEAVVKNIVKYTDDVSVDFYHNILGAWSYYLRGIIKSIGYMDEHYVNAFEHVDHTYQIIQKGLHPPFWWFADAHESWKDIEDIKKYHEGSVIRKNQAEWQKNFNNACSWFQHKHGFIPMQMPETPQERVGAILETIQQSYARNVLNG